MTLLSPASAAPVRARPGRLAVPWATVITLALLIDFADGFWTTSLHNAVGAIERIQEPFTSYWRTSLVLLPVFVLAVLGALTLALRRFGPELHGRKQGLVTVLLVASAATLVGTLATVVSSVADYRLQSGQLNMMTSMRSTCDAACLAGQKQSTFWAHVRAISYISGFMLLTNLLVVGWLVALRGGRLRISALKPAAATTARAVSGLGQDLRLLLVVGLVASAAIHAAVVPEHLAHWSAAGAFFLLLSVAEVAVAGVLLARRQRTGLVLVAVVSVGPLAVWLVSRTTGLPFGPGAGTAEAVGVPDVVACALEVATLLAAVALLRTAGWLRRPAASEHHRALALLTVVAVATIGLAGAAPGWIDGLTAAEVQQHWATHHP
jgi:hypothetical protein